MSTPERGRPQIGDVRMSYTMQPVGRDGQWTNGGNDYANADTRQRAREWAEQMLRHESSHLGHLVIAVEVYGREMRLGHQGWEPVKGGWTESFTVTREGVGMEPVFLTRETACWDTTVLDRAERVHAMKSDGSCQCGDPGSGYGGARV